MDFSDFEQVLSSRAPGLRSDGFKRMDTPGVRIGAHKNTKSGNLVRIQFSVTLNNKLMKLARFVSGDRVNVFFSKDHSAMVLERHPKGSYSLSPVGAGKQERTDAIGNPHISSVKFLAPEWCIANNKLLTGFKVLEKDIAIEANRIMVEINL